MGVVRGRMLRHPFSCLLSMHLPSSSPLLSSFFHLLPIDSIMSHTIVYLAFLLLPVFPSLFSPIHSRSFLVSFRLVPPHFLLNSLPFRSPPCPFISVRLSFLLFGMNIYAI